MFTSLIFLRHQPNRLSSRSECHCANHSDSWSNCYIDSAHTKPNASESNKLSVCTAWLSIYASFIFYASASSDSGSLCGCVPEKNGIQNHQIGRSAVLSVCVAYMSQCSCGHSLKLFVFGVVRAQLSSAVIWMKGKTMRTKLERLLNSHRRLQRVFVIFRRHIDIRKSVIFSFFRFIAAKLIAEGLTNGNSYHQNNNSFRIGAFSMRFW